MTPVYDMHEAKTHLSRLAERAAAGEEVVIARAGRPLAKLVPVGDERPRRRLGLWSGQVFLREDFDDPLPPESRAPFEGGGAA